MEKNYFSLHAYYRSLKNDIFNLIKYSLLSLHVVNMMIIIMNEYHRCSCWFTTLH